MRRLAALLIATATMTLAAATPAAAFTPFVGSYGGYATDGGRVIFGTHAVTNMITGDYIEARSFNWGSHVNLFSNARVEHVDGVWRFHTHGSRWQVHGHWLDQADVQGSICILDSNGSCPGGDQLIHYDAQGKTGK